MAKLFSAINDDERRLMDFELEKDYVCPLLPVVRRTKACWMIAQIEMGRNVGSVGSEGF